MSKNQRIKEGQIIRGGNNGQPTTSPVNPTPQNLRPSNPGTSTSQDSGSKK